MAARAKFSQQRGRGGGADLFVGGQQGGPADAGLVRVGLEGFECGQHDADPALHVGHARTVQGAVGACRYGLEGAVGGEDGVVVAGQDDLDRGLGPGGDGQAVGVGLGDHRAAVGHGGRGFCRHAHDGGGQATRLGLQHVQHPRQTSGVAAAGVDTSPGDGPRDDDVALGRDVVEHGLVVGFNPHGGDPRRGRGKGEGGAVSRSRTWENGTVRDRFAAAFEESRMNRRFSFPNPFGPVDSGSTAAAMARLSAWGFWLWSAVGLLQAGLVWYASDASYAEFRGATTGFAVFFALIAGVLGWTQWRRPNRILPVFGLAWALYELSSTGVSLLVGAPLGVAGVPAWGGAVAAAAMLACAVLHVGGLRGSAALARDGLKA
ncbi:hypothetical protein D3C72_1046990 [compost metagenome]